MSDDHTKAIVAQQVQVQPVNGDDMIHPLAKAAMRAILPWSFL